MSYAKDHPKQNNSAHLPFVYDRVQPQDCSMECSDLLGAYIFLHLLSNDSTCISYFNVLPLHLAVSGARASEADQARLPLRFHSRTWEWELKNANGICPCVNWLWVYSVGALDLNGLERSA